MKLGIDVGRVLSSPGDDAAPDTSFLRGSLTNALQTPPYQDMFEVVPRLVHKFEARVWIISKCGAAVQERTRQWLAHHRFFERTGIDPLQLRFCLKRPQKAEHCVELGITHFIDDRTDVLEAMSGAVPNRYLLDPRAVRCPAGSRLLRPGTAWPNYCCEVVGRAGLEPATKGLCVPPRLSPPVSGSWSGLCLAFRPSRRVSTRSASNDSRSFARRRHGTDSAAAFTEFEKFYARAE